MLAIAGKKNYSMIGRMLYKTHPEVASSIESTLKPGFETDLSRIFFFYSRFTGIDLPDYNEVARRRLFIATMLKFYHPAALDSGIINIRKGFCKNIGACFSAKQESITRNIREVVTMNKVYEDFSQTVEMIFEKLKNAG